ncbi:MAG TPA: helix-turn-helix domain-containing protein [Nocardioides sp.]
MSEGWGTGVGVSIHAYDAVVAEPGTHRGTPSPTVTFVLPVGRQLDVGWQGEPATRVRQWSTVSGLHTRPAIIHHDGTEAGVQLGLTAGACRTVLGVPAAAVAGELLEVATLLERAPWLTELPERLAACHPDERAPLVRRAIARSLAEQHRPVAPAVAEALRLLGRGTRVGEAAEAVGYSRRRLSTLVRAETGVDPQTYARLARLERARSVVVDRLRAGAGDEVRLADVAATAGYADHAHLTREWQALVGCAPTTWLREEFPMLQAEVVVAA